MKGDLIMKKPRVSENTLDMFKDLIQSYSTLLEQIEEEDEFMDRMRQSRILDCEQAIVEIEKLTGNDVVD